jgi:outer membrane immunogenic protein
VGHAAAQRELFCGFKVWRWTMKKFLLAGAASFLMLGAAQAADLPSVEEPVFAPVAQSAPAFNWSGFYGGVNVGYGFGEFPNNAALGLTDAGGFLGGVQAGYNYQFNQIVIGAEADWQLSNIEDTAGGVNAIINNFGTVRGRIGFAADRFMPYLTGGYAFANTEVTAGGVTDSNFHNGWVVGAGVEYAWTNNITTKLEGLYADFDNKTFGGLAGTPSAGAEVFLIRTGLNFKF